MPVEMGAEPRQRLREALIEAFPSWGGLRIMVADQLDERLGVITAQSNPLDLVAFDLVEWARARGRLGALLVGARNANPDNPALFVVAQQAGLTSSDASRSTLEKLVGGNTTFLDVAVWRAALTKLEWKVCRIDHDGRGRGTGFLVGPDAVLTNYHVVEAVIRTPAVAGRWSCRFDYKVSEAGDVVTGGTSVPFATGDGWLIDAAPYSPVDTMARPKPHDPAPDELDFALLRLAERLGARPVAGEAGEPRSWLPLSTAPVDFAAVGSLAILQHPETQPLKLALGMEAGIEVNGAGNRFTYTLPTLPGSSGSPVFDSDWRLIGLHHSGDPHPQDPEYNEGIPIPLIAARPGVAAYVEQVADEEG